MVVFSYKQLSQINGDQIHLIKFRVFVFCIIHGFKMGVCFANVTISIIDPSYVSVMFSRLELLLLSVLRLPPPPVGVSLMEESASPRIVLFCISVHVSLLAA